MQSNSDTIPCPLCQQKAPFHFRTQDYNRRITNEEFKYYRCPTCKLVFLAPIPEDLGRYYPDGYYAIPGSVQRLDQIARRQRYQIDLVRKFVSSGPLLEIGPGFGVFARLAKEAGFAVETIEMDGRCCRYLREVVGVEAIQSDDPAKVLQRMEPQQVIALWHVIEHLPDPWLCMRRAAARLEPGGILVIAAPNPHALQFRIFRSRWAHLDAPRHVQLIPASLLVRELVPAGLEPVMITSNDRGGRGWNTFGWQRGLMNLSTRRSVQLAAWGAGWLMSRIASLVEARDLQGSTYTAVFRKTRVEDQ
jgi:protein-L-isoaspartate O-methyltransferase